MSDQIESSEVTPYETNTIWKRAGDLDDIYAVDRVSMNLEGEFMYSLNDGIEVITVHHHELESMFINITADLKPISQEVLVPFSYGKAVTPDELFKLYQQSEINALMMSRRRVNPYTIVEGQGNLRQAPVPLKDAVGYWMSDTVMMTTEETTDGDVEYIVEHTLVGYLFPSKLGNDQEDVMEAEDMSVRFALVPTHLDPTFARGENHFTIYPPTDFDYTPIQVDVDLPADEAEFEGDDPVH